MIGLFFFLRYCSYNFYLDLKINNTVSGGGGCECNFYIFYIILYQEEEEVEVYIFQKWKYLNCEGYICVLLMWRRIIINLVIILCRVV